MALPATIEEFNDAWRAFEEKRGFEDIASTLGVVPHSVTAQTMSMSIKLTPALSQASGMYSAAALFGAADITGTFTAMQIFAEKGQFPLAVQSNVNFLSNSKAAQAVATAKVLRGGGSVAVLEVSVTDEAGKDLVHATFTYVLKERKLGI